MHQSEACTHKTDSKPQPGCVGWYREWQKKLHQRFFLINGPLSASFTVHDVLNIVPTNNKYVKGTCPTNPSVGKPVVYSKFHSKLSLNPLEFFWPMLKTLCTVQWENSELGPLKLEEYWCCCFLSRLIEWYPPTQLGWSWLSARCVKGYEWWCTYRNKPKKKCFRYQPICYVTTYLLSVTNNNLLVSL